MSGLNWATFKLGRRQAVKASWPRRQKLVIAEGDGVALRNDELENPTSRFDEHLG